jgi:hypothetical protein
MDDEARKAGTVNTPLKTANRFVSGDKLFEKIIFPKEYP